MRRLACIALLVALTAGCLLKETTHTLYLDPDGSVTWVVLERDIRSDEEDIDRGRAEEHDFLDLVRAGRNEVALAFDELGARRVEARVLRVERPYTVSTEGRFSRIDTLLEELFAGLEVDVDVGISIDGDRVRLDVAGRPDPAEDGDDETLGPLVSLLDEAERYRLVLTDGKFVDAVGFRLEQGDTVAVPLEPSEDAIERDGGRLSLSLTWENRRN